MIEVKDLSHSFGKTQVLKDISLFVAEGEILGVMGSSGGGKTTLLRCISGLINPTLGKITVDGVDVKANPEEARLRMGMVFQGAALFDYLNVEQNVLFGVRRHLRLSKTEEASLLKDTLNRVGLVGSENLEPSELSGGMRKRVGMARAIALNPKVLLYDEPTTGLDPITTYQIDELVAELRQTLGMTSVLVSHDLISVQRTVDRVAFLHKGEIVFLGTPEEFLESDHPAIREVVEKSQAKTLTKF
ncbi:MAG: ATP-binding cassette domain-containing protein [Armatimonadetes bacterium]|nr:ATP-binding cassette domain-containing protein [Armatimonadota bacterium]